NRIPREKQMRKPPAESAEDVIARELPSAPGTLDPRTEQVERVHVQGEMPEPAMHEHVRRDRPPRPPEVMHLEPKGLLYILRAHYRQLQEVDRDVDRDQPLHGGRDPGSLGVVGDLVGHAGPATAIYGSTRNHNYTVRHNRLFLERLGYPCTPDAVPSLFLRPANSLTPLL